MAKTKTTAKPKTDLALPARIPWDPAIETLYGDLGVNQATWLALIDTMFPTIKDPVAIRLALSYAKARRLDPFKVPIHIVPFWDSDEKRYRLKIMNSIADLRATAFRTGEYAGKKATRWGPTVEISLQNGTWKKKLPQWCQITVQRLVGEKVCDFEGPTVFWEEAYTIRGGKEQNKAPNSMWDKRSTGMLEKCAEAAAIRVAFPEETGALKIAEEIATELDDLRASKAKDVTDQVVEVEPDSAKGNGAAETESEVEPFSFVNWEGEIEEPLTPVEFASLYCSSVEKQMDEQLIKGMAESNADEVHRLETVERADLVTACRTSTEKALKAARASRQPTAPDAAPAPKSSDAGPLLDRQDTSPDLLVDVRARLGGQDTVETLDREWGDCMSSVLGGDDTDQGITTQCRTFYVERRQALVDAGKLR